MSFEPSSIGKSTLISKDLESTASFFENKLGLKKIDSTDEYFTFDLGSSELMLVEQMEGIDLTSFSAEGEPDLTINTSTEIDTIVTQLGKQEIILLKGPVDNFIHGTEYQSVYFRDPDNHLIEIRSNNVIELNRGDLKPEKDNFTHPAGVK